MSAFSNYLEAAILNATLRGVEFPDATANVYVALFAADPTDANITANELTDVDDPGYARVAVPNASWGAPTDGGDDSMETSNTTAIEFPAATATWADSVTHFGIYDAPTAGNLLYYGVLPTPPAPISVNTGDILRYGIGALLVRVK